MNDIKVYKDLTYVETTEWELFILEDDAEEVKKVVANEKHLDVWTALIHTSYIKKVYKVDPNNVDQMVIGIQDKNIRAQVQARVNERRMNGQRLNTAIVANIINRLSS